MGVGSWNLYVSFSGSSYLWYNFAEILALKKRMAKEEKQRGGSGRKGVYNKKKEISNEQLIMYISITCRIVRGLWTPTRAVHLGTAEVSTKTKKKRE